MILLKPNASRSKASGAGTTSAAVPQKHNKLAAVASKPKSHVDHLADRVSTDFILLLSVVLGHDQQLTGRIGRSIGTACVRQVSCWTTFILIQ